MRSCDEKASKVCEENLARLTSNLNMKRSRRMTVTRKKAVNK